MTARVLLETADVLVVDKPAGRVSIRDRLGSPGVKEDLEVERGEKLWVVHRLDREVGGVLLFARNAAAHRAWSLAFEHGRVAKTYSAHTEGRPPGAVGWSARWTDLLARGKKRTFVAPHGKESVTDVVWLGVDARGFLEWELHPKTGRTHQLRVQLASRGFPIVGDELYGAAKAERVDGIALVAVRLDCADLAFSVAKRI